MSAKVLAVKITVLLTLLAGISTAGVKYVAVVETEVDAQSGAASNLNPAEVRQITAELRRVAVANLPRSAYNIMTSETVMAQGGAVLEECADENCVITLGSKIGADYIVRGTVSKFQTMLTLSVEVYETENGTLVASSDPVRSENPAELLGLAAAACANMYKTFANARNLSSQTKTEQKPVEQTPKKLGYYIAPKYQTPLGTPVLLGGVNLEGGLVWGKGAFLGIGLDFGSGSSDTFMSGFDELFVGGSINFGYVCNLWGGLQFVYGGSAGLWVSYDVERVDPNDYIYIRHEGIYLFAPFIKLRWKFVELTYRVPLGLMGEYYDVYLSDGSKVGGGEVYSDKFNYSHQLMIGLYFRD